MKLLKHEKVVLIACCVAIPVLVGLGALVKLEHWSETTYKVLFASGLFLSAILSFYILLKSRKQKK